MATNSKSSKASKFSKLVKPMKIEALTDAIKDEIDSLHDIAPKLRVEAAKDLAAYIQLHFIDYPEGA
jgi:hypothetical protein